MGQSDSQVLLVVEDDANTAYLICRALHKMAPQCEVRRAMEGNEAMQELLREPRPAVLITDLDMPIMNGFQLIEWTRSVPALADLRIVVFSGSDEPDARRRCGLFQVDGYIIKTGSMTQLQNRVEALLEKNHASIPFPGVKHN